MRRRRALILVVGVVLFLFFLLSPKKPERETATLERFIDGDTADLTDGRRIRLLNINTPEKGEFGSDEAIAFVKRYEGADVELEITGTEKYGRLLARVYVPEYLNEELVEQGLAKSFLVDEQEVKRFANAQQSAYEHERGIWKRSDSYGCLQGKIDKKQERIDFDKRCEQSVVGWTVADESTRFYRIKREPADRFVLFSGSGTENASAFFWKRGHVWNDDRDTLSVRDDAGLLVLYQQYGY